MKRLMFTEMKDIMEVRFLMLSLRDENETESQNWNLPLILLSIFE